MLMSVEIGLECDLLGWLLEVPIAEPHFVTVAPGLALESQVIAQQERLDPNPRPPHIYASSMPCSNEIADRLVQGVGDPNAGQLSSSQET